MKKLNILVVSMMSLASPVMAQDLTVSQGDVRACFVSGVAAECIGDAANVCQGLPGGSTTQGIGACLFAETAVWEAILNEEYQALQMGFAEVEPVGSVASAAELMDALRDAQRAWIAFRDADCDLRYALFQGGSIRTIVSASCRLRKTAQRAIELRDMGEL